MKKFIFFITLFLTVTTTSAMAEWVSTDFQKLSDKAVWEGRGIDTIAGLYMTLENQQEFDPAGDHTSHYFSTIGLFDSQDTFIPLRHELVFETWVLDVNDHWNIDQWLFRTDEWGVLQSGIHYFMVKDKVGRVLRNDRLPVSANKVQQEWNEKIKHSYLVFLQNSTN